MTDDSKPPPPPTPAARTAADDRAHDSATRQTAEALVRFYSPLAPPGYRFEIDADGTTRMYRPDGSLALEARKTRPRPTP